MKKQKMNVLFKIAFILLIICVLLILASIIIAYAFDSEKWSAITSASGVLLATVGIILGMLSKPKKVKLKDENKEKLSILETIIRKNRDGDIGTVYLAYNRITQEIRTVKRQLKLVENTGVDEDDKTHRLYE